MGNLWRREKTTEGATTNFTRISTTKNMFPFYRGNVSGAVDNRSGNSVPYNFVNTVMLHWVAAAFSGWRGSIRYKLMFDKCNHFAAGEDFQVYFFTGLPRMYYEAIPPDP